jgi:hypothetical protein
MMVGGGVYTDHDVEVEVGVVTSAGGEVELHDEPQRVTVFVTGTLTGTTTGTVTTDVSPEHAKNSQ